MISTSAAGSLSRRRLLGGLATLAVVGAAGAGLPVLPAAARPTGPFGPTGASANGTGFRTAKAPLTSQVVPLAGVRRGRVVAGSATAVAHATVPETLVVSLDVTEQENYWYFAQGVVVTASGLWSHEKAVIEDIGPDGRVVTFDAVQADADGALTARVKYPDLNPAVGAHVLRVTSSNGQVGSARLDIVPWELLTLTVTVTPATITRTAWLDEPITVSATGLKAHQRVALHFIQPDAVGYRIGANEQLRADAAGVFRYQVQATSVLVPPGTWEVIVSTENGEQGYTTFTLTEPTPPTRIGRIVVASTVTADELTSSGIGYRIARMAPFELILITLRTPRGIDNVLGVFRLDGDGRHVNAVTAFGQVPYGTYTIIVESLTTGRWNQARFTVTEADGSVPNPMSMVLPDARISRLEAMDPTVGIRAEGHGFAEGDVVEMVVKDGQSVPLRMTPESITARPADSDGLVAFTVHARTVPVPGRYTVFLSSFAGGDPVNLRQTLTITR